MPSTPSTAAAASLPLAERREADVRQPASPSLKIATRRLDASPSKVSLPVSIRYHHRHNVGEEAITMAEPYTLDRYIEDLRRITRETDNEDEIISRVGPLAQRMAVEKDWL